MYNPYSPADFGVGVEDFWDDRDDPAETTCGLCGGAGLDPACDGHPVEGGRLYCGCPLCNGADATVRLSHSDLAALAAD